ncbi:unnamed protein product [Schistosoma mattheei]|uniref:Uncharacterized protein n=1 Tax=Schistosoma mattheei TaxID=31246 RepID=A0A183NUD4_9TREM|nr:unnamed protein product [Schistosoma mattheei]
MLIGVQAYALCGPTVSVDEDSQPHQLICRHSLTPCPSDYKTETNLPLNIQPNNIPATINSSQFPSSSSSSSLYDQPTTLIKTYGDDSGDKWTVYYRNPNIPNVHIESIDDNNNNNNNNNKTTQLHDHSISNQSNLQQTSYNKTLSQYSNEYSSQINNQLLIPDQKDGIPLKQINKIITMENTMDISKKKRKKHRFYSIKQTEYLIEALESLTNSIEKNNINLELELKDIDLDNKQSLLMLQNTDINLHRNSSLTTKLRPKSFNTKYGIINRHEYKRKSAGLNHTDELNHNRIEKNINGRNKTQVKSRRSFRSSPDCSQGKNDDKEVLDS